VSGIVDDDGIKSQRVCFDSALLGERLWPIMKLDYENLEPARDVHPQKSFEEKQAEIVAKEARQAERAVRRIQRELAAKARQEARQAERAVRRIQRELAAKARQEARQAERSYFSGPFQTDPSREPFREWLMSLPKTDVSFHIEGPVDSVEKFYDNYVTLTGEVLPESSKYIQPNKWGLELRVQFPNPPEGLPLPDERKKTRAEYEESTPRQVTDTRKEWACNDLVKYLFKGGLRPRGINAPQT
jgi:hypothetical protein